MPTDDYDRLRNQIQDQVRDLNQTTFSKQLAATITAGMVDTTTDPKDAVEKFWAVFRLLSPQEDC